MLALFFLWLNTDLGWYDLIQFKDVWSNFHVGDPLDALARGTP